MLLSSSLWKKSAKTTLYLLKVFLRLDDDSSSSYGAYSVPSQEVCTLLGYLRSSLACERRAVLSSKRFHASTQKMRSNLYWPCRLKAVLLRFEVMKLRLEGLSPSIRVLKDARLSTPIAMWGLKLRATNSRHDPLPQPMSRTLIPLRLSIWIAS